MSDTTNVIAKQKALYHDANSSNVSDAVEAMHDIIINVKLPTGSDGNAAVGAADDSLVVTTPVDAKLVSAYFAATVSITNEAANTIALTIKTNGETAVSFDSDDLAATVAANAIAELTVNAANSFLDAGEVCLIAYTQQQVAENYLEGELVLTFRRQ